jgi:multicomponent Na+:H+ antiporter subunit G
VLSAVAVLLVAGGLFFFLGTSIGLVRFPDCYTRVHAAGKGDTLSSILILTGLALLELREPSLAAALTALKIVSISVFVFVASPTATHAIMDAAFGAKMRHWTRSGDRECDDPGAGGEGR